MKLALLPFGSAGDVLPFIWLARQLRAHGHQVVLITASLFQKSAEAAGLPFVPIGKDTDFETLIRDPRIWKMGIGTKAVFEYAAQAAGEFHEALARHSAEEGPPDLLLAPVTSFGARLTRETSAIPLVTVHLQPAVLLSAHDTPVILPALHPLLRLLPVRLKRLIFRYGPNPVDLFGGAALRQLCARHGVPAPKSFFRDWWDSPDGSLLLFPDWFAAPQPDWPEPRYQHQFPLEDLSSEQPLTPALLDFLTRHRSAPPVVFTAGSANVQASAFFATAAAALERLGRPGVFVTRDLSQLPSRLPATIHSIEYAAFGPLLRHAGAFVHHGGIGTLSQGFAARVPQLLMPMAHDQPDNAHRLRRLHAGDFITPRRFTPPRVAAALDRLLNDPSVAESCQNLASKIAGEQSPETTASLINWLQRAATSGKSIPAC